jgi:hypothetical protein
VAQVTLVGEREALLGMHFNPAQAELNVTFRANAENHATWLGAKKLLSANEVSLDRWDLRPMRQRH